ncbi:MAG: cation-translocating P-type ATPase [Planctomycetes bacterium]|nr:cation-translocating P-type ATPase [Planctomycetota bacterium]
MEETKITNITMSVEGMHCPSCAANIERSIEHLSGVVKASVNFASSEVAVQYDPQRVDMDQIKKAVAKPGYKVRESVWAKSKTFWQERKFFIQMVVTGLLVIASWAFMHSNPLASKITAMVAVIAGGYSVFIEAVRVLLIPDLGVSVLISIASIAAVAVGAYTEAAMVILIMLVGETLEHVAVRKTHQAIAKLMQLAPSNALVKRGDKEEEVAVEDVHIDDIVIIKPGGRIPVDGIIAQGEGLVNQSMLTGEAIPASKAVGDKVYAGTLNEGNAFEIKVSQVGEGTKLAHIKRLVLQAEMEKSPIQRLADRFARYFIPVVFLIALVIFLMSDPSERIFKVITVFVAACPCAMVLAAPTAVVAGLGNAAKKGILIKGGQYLETFGHLHTLLMDKTGTLTEGKIKVTDIKTLNNHSEKDIIYHAAIAEKRSEHPIAKAVLNYANEKKMDIPDPVMFEVHKGMGVTAKMSDEVAVGNRALMKSRNISVSPETEKMMEALEKTGKTVLMVSIKGVLAGLVAVADTLRSDAEAIIKNIRKAGVKRIALLTGDNARTAEYIAKQAGIDEWYSDLMPEDKIAKLKEIKQSGVKTGMIGDGINDAPSLAAADVGIAMGTIGSEVAIEAADVSLMRDDLSMVPVAIKLSRRVWNTIIQNFVFSIAYNIGMITLIGFAVHDHSGITLGAVLHQLSCLLVVASSLRLLRG